MKKRLLWLSALLGTLLLLCACGAGEELSSGGWAELEPESYLELEYAQHFTVARYAEGYRLVTIAGTNRYLVVPEGAAAPEGLPAEITVLQQPMENIYLVATSAMDLFRALDSVDRVRLSGTDASGWHIPQARQALEKGTMRYAGKYSAPDYELILSEQCGLAVESTMIFHKPEVKEKLEALGIPVLVEYSSYESHPLGRMEWVKLYGVLLGEEKLAQQVFDQQARALASITGLEHTGKSVAFFYISSNGMVNVRKPGDYVARMIELAGGTYLPAGQAGEDNALSTMNMQMERFYAQVRDADYLIYNSTVDGELRTVAQLLEKEPLLADFKAVRTGNVFCTSQNLFQESMGLGTMILDIHSVLTQDRSGALTYLYRLT